ncbi:MAG TPA: DUF5009 domain-containing protein [Verrucomicrobiales bacterium]|nr:DUF5009 domain-containing protein [Verrucomicrobiales bacterium]
MQASEGGSLSTGAANSLTRGTHRARVLAIDALRGFDMFWIIGADALVHALAGLRHLRAVDAVAAQLEHVEWEGFHFYDLIFPLFVFLMGSSLVYSLGGLVERKGRRAAMVRLARRTLLLYALGVFYYGAMSVDDGLEQFRFLGVLQRIALCYGLAGLAYLWLKPQGLAVLTAALLGGYWVLLSFVPVPGHGPGVFEPGRNFANYIDAVALPGFKWNGTWDPEGLLSTLPAVASALLGVGAGLLLKWDGLNSHRKSLALAGAGAVCLALGWLWSLHFPVIKSIWTSSYVLVAGGWSALLLALFHEVLDVRGWTAWATPFVWIGMNPITIYMLTNLVDFEDLVRRVLHRPLVDLLSPFGELLVAAASLLLAVGVCAWLYRKRIFLRV